MYGVNKQELRRIFSKARVSNHEYIMISTKDAVGKKVNVIHRNQIEQWETEYENNFWEINGKLIDIRNETIEIVDFASGMLGAITNMDRF